MYLSNSMLMNDVRSANVELVYEGYQDVDNRNDAIADLQSRVLEADHDLVGPKDYGDPEDYQVACDDFWDGPSELCFVKRDSALFAALANFYSKDGSIDSFEANGKKFISGFLSQLRPSKASVEGYEDEAGFWFVAGDGYIDALVPYRLQKKFEASVNPTLAEDVKGNLNSQAYKMIKHFLHQKLQEDKKFKSLGVPVDHNERAVSDAIAELGMK